MTKNQFKTLFERALDLAAESAEKQLGKPVPRVFEIEMHGAAAHPRTMKKDEALDAIYLGPDRFYRIIDVSIIRVTRRFNGIRVH